MNEYNNMQNEIKKESKAQLLAVLPGPDNGLGSISFKNFENESDFSRELAVKCREIVESGVCIVDCNHEDDGCIDGRCVNELAVPDGDHFNTKRVIDNSSNERAKVAGGGLVTGLAMFKAIGEDLVSPDEDLKYLAEEFAKQGVYCGAHTGSHGSIKNQKTDCGANDRFDEILKNTIDNQDDVEGIVKELLKPLGVSVGNGVLSSDLRNWNHVLTQTNNFAFSSGSSRLESIKDGILAAQDSNHNEDKVTVIKNLEGNHNEIFLVVNYAQGLTFSQTKLREALHEDYPDVDLSDLPQVFALDIWRIDQLAQAVARIPKKHSTEPRTVDETNQRYLQALYAGTAFQVGTYVSLTDGSLPVFLFHS